MKTTRTCELTRHVSLCSGTQLMAHGRVLTPDHASAFGECHLAHAFPVTTVDGTALHPQVVANSFHFMLWKVVDFFHVIKAYDPENHPRDYAVGTVIDVEFPRMPEGGVEA